MVLFRFLLASLAAANSQAFVTSFGFKTSSLHKICRSQTSIARFRMLEENVQNIASVPLNRRKILQFAIIASTTALTRPIPSFSENAVESDLSGIGSSRSPIVVIGAGGKTGKECVRALLRKGGYSVRATVRGSINKDDLGTEQLPADDVDLLEGIDVTKPETLSKALEGAGACIFASSASFSGGNALQVDCLGAENVARACLQAGVRRLVVISSLAVTRPDTLAYKFTNVLGNIMDYKAQGEERVRRAYDGQAALSYTIIRPGGLVSGKPEGLQGLQVSQGDTIAGEVDRADLAEAAVGAIFTPSTAFATLELMRAQGAAALEDKYKADPYFVSGRHTTARPYPLDAVILGPSESAAAARAAFGELYGGLKRDSDYDPSNAYKPARPAP